MIKEYIINGKGYFGIRETDHIFSTVDISDIKFGYGYIEFKGTNKQLDLFLESLYKDESNFKVIGVHYKKDLL
jgi:hypothetical protein|tara:strand:- start:589 stop:807 length:219 start_codon:yes stop_codon:yes gene_type:complete